MLPRVFSTEAVESFIIDSEVVAVNKETGALQAFQVLQHRGRKNVSFESVTIPVCVFAFDILYFNGSPQMTKPLLERRQVLYSYFTPIHAAFQFAEHLDGTDVEEIQSFLDRSIKDGCEGLMVKTLKEEAAYTPAKRSYCWLKLKKDYMDGVTDTLDLVPIGAYYGKGKRTGVFGGFLLACYNSDSDEFQSICKIGSGFWTSSWKVSRKLFSHSFSRSSHGIIERGKAGCLVRGLKCMGSEGSRPFYLSSSLCRIRIVDPSKGIALRFPRFVRVREDKKANEATFATQIAAMYTAQSLSRKNYEEYDEET
ncbi:putative DNA ligase I [Trypanosoma cruzi]|uniref:DNA ligase 1 n=1 Tax=Trypanosoma cruzi TaxID=5693 RepID=A0A2V2WEW4_TRYCR|nr:putative DNA ligase I [Trypanosoma cruzi]